MFFLPTNTNFVDPGAIFMLAVDNHSTLYFPNHNTHSIPPILFPAQSRFHPCLVRIKDTFHPWFEIAHHHRFGAGPVVEENSQQTTTVCM
jgi:hypothetical protein